MSPIVPIYLNSTRPLSISNVPSWLIIGEFSMPIFIPNNLRVPEYFSTFSILISLFLLKSNKAIATQ